MKRPSVNNLGQPIHPLAQGVEAFWRWFAGSTVVDEAGRPIVVYHATDADFDSFEFSEDIGFHFGTALTANARAQVLEDPRTVPVYLRLKNPLRLPDLHTWSPQDVIHQLHRAGVLSDREADRASEAGVIVDREQVRRWLSKAGYDGIVYLNETEGLVATDTQRINAAGADGLRALGAQDSYIAMEPWHIKSALGNDGFFAPRMRSFVGARHRQLQAALRGQRALATIAQARVTPAALPGRRCP